MKLIKNMTGILGLAWAIVLLTACDVSPDSPAQANETHLNLEARLVKDQEAANAAISRANIASASDASTDPAADDECDLTSAAGAARSSFEQDIKDLQDSLQSILQDVQSSDQASTQAEISAEVKKFQDALAEDIQDVLAQIQSCIPKNSTSTDLPIQQGGAMTGSQSLDLSQILRLPSGAH
jgi:hypothetical protein